MSRSKNTFGLFGLILTILLIVELWLLATTAGKGETSCPMCKNKFEATFLVSTTTGGGQDTDFLFGAARDPHPIMVYPITCPKCLYSGYTNEFGEKASVMETVKVKILKGKALKPYAEVKSAKDSDDFPAWVRYDLIAQVYQISGTANGKIADQYLRASWAVRLGVDPLDKLSTKLSQKAREVIDNTWINKEAADEGVYNYEITLGRRLLKELPNLKAEEKLVNGLAIIYLLRLHGENTLVIQVALDIKDLLPKDEAGVFMKYLGDTIKDERYFQVKCAAMLETSLKDMPEGTDKASRVFLCGELHRRLENWTKAREFYQAALKVKDCPDWVGQDVDEQMKLLPK